MWQSVLLRRLAGRRAGVAGCMSVEIRYGDVLVFISFPSRLFIYHPSFLIPSDCVFIPHKPPAKLFIPIAVYSSLLLSCDTRYGAIHPFCITCPFRPSYQTAGAWLVADVMLKVLTSTWRCRDHSKMACFLGWFNHCFVYLHLFLSLPFFHALQPRPSAGFSLLAVPVVRTCSYPAGQRWCMAW